MVITEEYICFFSPLFADLGELHSSFSRALSC